MKTMTRRPTLTVALAAAPAASATGLAASAAALAADKDLVVFNWSCYEDPGFHPQLVAPEFKQRMVAEFEKIKAG
ncbi:hypothetical protein NKI95_03615 [Mesorhizobium sp. M0306]|uniref:hypothetical protein n=1 Tax=Mesorhizobium sp. M0306 TaxID=2956932 RepID=UPI00333DE1EE